MWIPPSDRWASNQLLAKDNAAFLSQIFDASDGGFRKNFIEHLFEIFGVFQPLTHVFEWVGFPQRVSSSQF